MRRLAWLVWLVALGPSAGCAGATSAVEAEPEAPFVATHCVAEPTHLLSAPPLVSSSRRIGSLEAGDRVEASDSFGGGTRVRTATGATGYVRDEALRALADGTCSPS